MSLPGKLYEKFDNGMMYLANNAVHAWNWTTGKGKASLANKLYCAGAVGIPVGEIVAGNTILGSVLIPLWSLIFLSARDGFNESEKRETKALEAGCLDALVESRKERYKESAAVYLGIGTAAETVFILTCPYLDTVDNIGCQMTAGSFFSLSASYYVMRTDSLPPRKNCVKRGIDWAKKKWAEISQPEPVPSPSLVGNMDYFDYFARQGYGREK